MGGLSVIQEKDIKNKNRNTSQTFIVLHIHIVFLVNTVQLFGKHEKFFIYLLLQLLLYLT